jgi:hypothetical protein
MLQYTRSIIEVRVQKIKIFYKRNGTNTPNADIQSYDVLQNKDFIEIKVNSTPSKVQLFLSRPIIHI